MKKILAVTGTRAEYGLLKDLIKRFEKDNVISIHLGVTGTHLSEKHGKTLTTIIEDGFKNIHIVDLEINGDRPTNISDGIALGIKGFSRLISELKPDLIIILGDRYELWSISIPATLSNIPIAHIHGGESTEGAIDESVRHSITKMSHLHFCSTELYRERIIRMGENPNHVWNVGAIGLDRIKRMHFFDKKQIEDKLNTKLEDQNILCTFHPVTVDEEQSKLEINQLITALEKILQNHKVKIFITLPNSDTFSNIIRESWNRFISIHHERVHGFVNLGDQLYLSLMKEVDLVLGNSSSGIIEAPFLKKAVVDIGKRQKGRLRSSHVIHAEGDCDSIVFQIEKAMSSEFKIKLSDFEQVYGEGETVEKIYLAIKNIKLEKILFKKFYDSDK